MTALLVLVFGQPARADFIPFADQIATNFYSLQLRGISFESDGQLAEVHVAEGTMDPASFGHIRITDLSANSVLFEQTYGELGGVCCSPQIRGSFAEQLLLPYATPLQIDMNGQEFSGMSVLYGDKTVASGGTAYDQYPSFSTSLTINTNIPPTAVDDSADTPRDQATAIGVLNNDSGLQLQLGNVSAPAHGTAFTSGTSVIYTPDAGYVGTDTFVYTVTNPAGSANATVTITVNPLPPSAASHKTSTTSGQPVTVTVVDSNPDQIVVASVSQPANGTAAMNGTTQVVYTPKADFVGEDQFTYTLSNSSGESTGTVTVVVGSTLNTAGDLVRQESLATTLQTILDTNSGSEALQTRIEGLTELLDQPGGLERVAEALTNISPEEAAAQALGGGRISRIQVGNVNQRLVELRAGGSGFSVNGLTLRIDGQTLPGNWLAAMLPFAGTGGASGDEASGFSRLGVFVNGQFEAGDRNSTRLQPGFSSKVYGFTAGVDYWITRRFLMGVSAGYGYTESKSVGKGGGLEIDGTTFSLFGSYQLTDRWYLDLVANGTYNQYDATRNIAYIDAFGPVQARARSDTQGWQQRYSLNSGYDFPLGPWTLGLRGRMEYGRTTIDAYTERGADPLNLKIDAQTVDSVTTALGGIVSYTASTAVGVFVSQFSAEWEHEFEKDGRLIGVRFAEDFGGNRFTVRTDSPDRDYVNLRTSVSAVLPGGGSAFVQYETLVDNRFETRHSVNAGVRLAF
ncbi:outer membrane autotransporter barrel domain protein [Methylocaldum marinum]|uniref:Outer membrane autotransporter barrel domain protein n=2 Tax=Methylocaldum marinum TaxID=1432792 RepID=A0A250KML1_9GAMM|nr:outer membrane autotransporter barrel domain protein [Methylocaldum marinum]